MSESSCTHASACPGAQFCPACGTRRYGSGGIDYSEFVLDRTRTFTGRDWVFQASDNWLADPRGNRVYFLTGGPGTGKSAIAARLVQIAAGAVSIDGCRHLVSVLPIPCGT